MPSFVPQIFTDTNEFYYSIVAVNTLTPDQLFSNALVHEESNLSGLFPGQYQLNVLTPVYANSLYWLI